MYLERILNIMLVSTEKLSDILLPPRHAHCSAWRLALSPLYEWMGGAVVTGSEAVVTALADRRWCAVWVKAGLE